MDRVSFPPDNPAMARVSPAASPRTRVARHATRAAGVRPLLASTLGPGRIPYARGVRAGDWIFASGVMAADWDQGRCQGLAPAVSRAASPYSGLPVPRREAACVLDRLGEVLAAGGSEFGRVVRSDQYFTTWRSVNAYHGERVQRFRPIVPPTTSVLVPGLTLPGASLDAQFIALASASRARIEPFYPEGLHVPSTSGFAPVLRGGDFLFIAGFMAAHQPGDLGGIAPEAKVPEGHLWKGTRIRLEAEYAMKHKIAVALAGAGADLARVVKAQVYLRDMADLPAFNEAWHHWFPTWRPAVSYVPISTPGLAIEDARVEINAIAMASDSRARMRAIDAGFHTGIDGQPAAVLAGDLLLCSALLAADGNGPLPGTRPDPRQPWFGSQAEAQVDIIVARARALCEQAGTRLENLVRLQLFVTDLAEVDAACRALARHLPGIALPLSIVQVPAPLPVPGCSLMADLWIHAP